MSNQQFKTIGRRFAIIMIVLAALMLQACDFFVAKLDGFNKVLGLMDAVYLAEDNSYNETHKYFNLEERDDIAVDLVNYVLGDFHLHYTNLVTMLDETEFTSDQLVVRDKFNEVYRPFMDEYVAFTNEFLVKIQTNNFSVEGLEEDLVKLETYSSDFLALHNQMTSLWLVDGYNIELIDF